jgi:dihydropteroate synthase
MAMELTPPFPKLMGILNITPDSFSDGGRFQDRQAAIDHALEMESQGADILDMGAESTRPGSRSVPAAEQLQRLLPVLRTFRRKSKLPVSIDTQSAKVAAACLAEGADIINDISALRRDRNMRTVLARSKCQIVLMHMQGTPRTMQEAPHYENVVADVRTFFEKCLSACVEAGISAERIWLDPGIGFGKTIEHNLALLRNPQELAALGRPLVVGLSRKRFLGTLTDEPAAERRVLASVVAGMLAAHHGAAILRVHDVAEHAKARTVWNAVSF